MQSLSESCNISSVGGKAHGLWQLLASNLPVPNGFVVPTEAYLDHEIKAFRGLSTSATTEDKATAILSTPVSESLIPEFKDSWDKYIGRASAAIRSSATLEDAPENSFAGQFLTLLDVRQKDALLALKKCWASLWTAHLTSYLSKRSQKTRPAMAVIVQKMVHPTFAGIAFTIEPMTGFDQVMYCEWVKGQGDNLVSGKRIDGRIWMSPRGIALREDYLTSSGRVPAPGFWMKLAASLKVIRESIGPRQDVEWAIAHNDLFLLQSRPITAEADDHSVPAPWKLPGFPKGGWTKTQQMYFDLWDEYNFSFIYPLAWQLYESAIWQASVDMLDFGSGTAPLVENFVTLEKNVPIALDPAARIVSPNPGEVRKSLCKDISVLENIRMLVDEVRKPVSRCSQLSDKELFKLLGKTAKLVRDPIVVRLLVVINMKNAKKEKAERYLKGVIKRLGLNEDEIIDVLSAGVDHETSRMNQALFKLALLVKRHAPSEIISKQLDEFLENYGHFETDGKLPTREAVAEQLRHMANMPVLVDKVDRSRKKSEELANNIRKKLKKSQMPAFDRALAGLKAAVKIREDYKWDSQLAAPLVQAVIKEIESRLHSRHLLKSEHFASLLTLQELKNALLLNIKPDATVLRDRAALIAWKQEQSWMPQNFNGKAYTSEDKTMYGIAASPGTGIGKAQVVGGPDDFGKVSPGDIVVARSTSPVWTQVLQLAGGVVVENGSRISHAAIVAREFGVPAVVGIPGIYSAIRDGEQLEVDGGNGKVTRKVSK